MSYSFSGGAVRTSVVSLSGSGGSGSRSSSIAEIVSQRSGVTKLSPLADTHSALDTGGVTMLFCKISKLNRLIHYESCVRK